MILAGLVWIGPKEGEGRELERGHGWLGRGAEQRECELALGIQD